MTKFHIIIQKQRIGYLRNKIARLRLTDSNRAHIGHSTEAVLTRKR